jgi:tetraacyldisaccharide 4'-kinase
VTSPIERLWVGEGAVAAAARTLLAPAEALYRGGVAARNAWLDRGRGVLPVACPALSVGNLTVGGTGKTPLAAWFARALEADGGRPAIVLRGYGDDEWRVHGILSPGVPVVRDRDRVRGIATAARAGADCVVLDDAFQHRRAARVADVVLLAVDAFRGDVRLLPAGPYRESLAALRRASLVVLTVKAASEARVEAAWRAVSAEVGRRVPIAIVGLEPGGLHRVPATGPDTPTARFEPAEPAPRAAPWGAPDSPSDAPLAGVAGRPVLALSAIGHPAAFEAALAAAGAQVTARRFRDHHAFTAAEVAALAAAAPAAGVVVCTLKDAVKLAPLWPHASRPLWYLSQTIVVRHGAEALAGAVHSVLAAREASSRTIRPIAG